MFSTKWLPTFLRWRGGPLGATVILAVYSLVKHTLHSTSGVQQGDPLGPLLFAAALHPLATELKTLGLDIAVHYLDDGLLAGDLGAVSAPLRLVQQRAAHLGLDLNLAKCEAVALHPQAVPTLHGALPDALLRHADGTCKVSQNFEFLGAAVGDAAFMQSHTTERAAKAGDLLDAIGVPEDPQVALHLLRACGGFTRMVHSMRCTPPTAHRLALNMFDGMVRGCFGDFSGIHPSDSQWDQATRGLNFAGLGLRATSLHAAGAYIASVGASLEACVDIDSAFSATAVKAAAGLQEGVAALNHSLGGGSLPLDDALALSQRDLSARLDVAGWTGQLGCSSLVDQAHLRSEAEPGARAFLTAVPSGTCRMEGPAFLTEVRVRLGVPDASFDTWCPRCDAVYWTP